MSEDREKKNVTAKDLLSRLGKAKSEVSAEEKKSDVPALYITTTAYCFPLEVFHDFFSMYQLF